MSREGIERTLRERWGVRVALVLALAVGVLIGTLVSNGVRAARENPGALAEPLPVPSAVELSSVFSKVAKEVEPAVVNISSETIIEPRARRSRPGSPEEFFERFFDFGVPFEFGPRTPQRQRSLGSGVLVDPNGYILTNYHVIHEADKIKVRLHGDSKEYPAEVIGFDEETDVAVVKISVERKLPVAQLGDSDGTQVGDWVLAIGSPFGLDATVTAGIISYKGREVTGGTQFQRFLQTDAAINHGNSGGPLVNLAGQVIGINTMIATDRSRMDAGNVGIGFALPSNIARDVYNQIRRQGRVVRGSIGISFRRAETENEVILRSFGADAGVLVDEVQPGGPADRAGLQRGDVITAVNG
ncbi:MAG: trypsin-like peptidase domain-containing protein, partial [Acidobacteria bacterium]|nr:trypsin-like peptidase domain-containing protein [Acidobacteriota bacterium]